MLAFSETARMMTSAVQQAVRLVLALGIGAAGGAVFQYFHLPLAWMVGAMLATTFGSVAGIRMQVPKRLHNAMLAIIGVLLGCTFTPDVLGLAAYWVPSITVVLVSQVLMGALVITLCYRFARYDVATSYFVGVPGALNQVTAMAPEMGADVRKVSLSHAIRVLVIIMAISFLSTFLMDASTLPATAPKHVTPPLEQRDWILLAACVLIGPGFASSWRLPNPALFGPIILSALFHITSSTAASPPVLLINMAQLVVGAAIGTRFVGVSWRELVKITTVALPLCAVMLAWTLGATALFSFVSGWNFVTSLLILTPGGLAEMSIVALSLNIDPALVSTHHVVRICVNLALVPMMFYVWQWAVMRSARLNATSANPSSPLSSADSPLAPIDMKFPQLDRAA
jgi:membrane AbrB-like protein